MVALHELGHRQNARLVEARRHHLQADGQPVTGLAGGHTAGGQAHQGDEERGRDPVDVVVERASVDLVREVHLDRIGLHRSSRCQQNIVALEQIAEAQEHLLARLLGGGEIKRGYLQARLDVALEIDAEFLELRQPRILPSDHPGAAPSLIAVSYTHLDVYKRQAQASPPRRACGRAQCAGDGAPGRHHSQDRGTRHHRAPDRARHEPGHEHRRQDRGARLRQEDR